LSADFALAVVRIVEQLEALGGFVIMETIEIPVVTQLPELSGGKENPVEFVEMVFTTFLRYDRAFLYAEHLQSDPPDSSVSWRIHPQVPDFVSREFEAGISPSLDSFRASLAYIRERYLGIASRHGCTERLMRQGNVVRRCLLFLPCSDDAGFWIRGYVETTNSLPESTLAAPQK
jgi:hypothetical protein